APADPRVLPAPVRTGPQAPADRPADQREPPPADRLLLHPGIRAGIGCPVQPVDGLAPRPVGPAVRVRPGHPQPAGPRRGARLLLSLRAPGERPIPSISFRSGVIDAENRIRMDEPTRFVTAPELVPNALYEKSLFHRKLTELGINGPLTDQVMGALGDYFTLD